MTLTWDTLGTDEADAGKLVQAMSCLWPTYPHAEAVISRSLSIKACCMASWLKQHRSEHVSTEAEDIAKLGAANAMGDRMGWVYRRGSADAVEGCAGVEVDD